MRPGYTCQVIAACLLAMFVPGPAPRSHQAPAEKSSMVCFLLEGKKVAVEKVPKPVGEFREYQAFEALQANAPE